MKHINRWTILIVVALLGLLAACSPNAEPYVKVEPAEVKAVAGSEFNQVILTARAAERLGIETEEIRTDSGNQMVVPYSAILYGLNGETWAYVDMGGLTYQRAPITIERIEGDTVYLTDGPPVGTEIVTVGVAELYGTDTGVGK